MDSSSFLGLLIALGGITAGLLIEGGSISQILQPTAAMIVFGGTLGAVMLQFPLKLVARAFGKLKSVFAYKDVDPRETIEMIIQFATKARKEGIVSLDKDLESIKEPFLKKTLMLAIDGTQPEELRKNMEQEMSYQAEEAERVPAVFEAAGGFSPTIGIIGAILGLIQVMGHLDQIAEVGRGIAVAFVATIYGVASANLFFLPIAGKLKMRLREEDMMRELMLEGVMGILEGMNPRMLQTKLNGFVANKAGAKGEKKAGAATEPASTQEAAT